MDTTRDTPLKFHIHDRSGTARNRTAHDQARGG